MVLIPLLGVTWLFGLLSPLHKAFLYIFVVLNSIQVCGWNSNILLLWMQLFANINLLTVILTFSYGTNWGNLLKNIAISIW